MHHDDLLKKAQSQYQAIRYEGPELQLPERKSRFMRGFVWAPAAAALLLAVSIPFWPSQTSEDPLTLAEHNFGKNPGPDLDPFDALKESRTALSDWGTGFGQSAEQSPDQTRQRTVPMPSRPDRDSGFSVSEAQPVS